MSSESENVLTVGDALPGEIKRCQELLAEYRRIPQGAFAAVMLEADIEEAHRAMVELDLPGMIRAYQALKEAS